MTLPNRLYVAGALAIAWPWTFRWWPLAVLVFLAFSFLRSVTAWVAAFGAVVMYDPRLWLVGLLGVLIAGWVRHRFPPGALEDSVRARAVSWLYLARTWSWRGGNTSRALEIAHLRSGGLALDGGPAHNEWLEVVYGYGVVGLGIVVAGVALLVPHLHRADALSASAVAAALVLAGSSPISAALTWLRKGREGPLFGPPMLATVTIHVTEDGQAVLYAKNLMREDHAMRVKIGTALMVAGDAFARGQ